MPAPPEITIIMPLDQLNQMMTLLATHPFNQVAETMAMLNQQARQQLQPTLPAMRGNGESRMVPAEA